jgi:formylglycine-generating enzyme required for sulfatase activity
MKFVAVPGTNTQFCIWLTRVQDYQAFVAATGRHWTQPDFKQGSTHPAVNVSWEDASAFADWLTQREHASGTLPVGWSYRLPTDAEWSAAVGLPANSPDGGDVIVYPWGTRWPPPAGAGNYSPELGVDPYPETSPVGSFKANALGLFDMGGNVWEWCQDYFNNSPDYRVLRGASWRMRDPEDLVSSKRIGNKSDITLPVYGFRVVIEMTNAK